MAAESLARIDPELAEASIISGVLSPGESRSVVPLSPESRALVKQNRQEVSGIIKGTDPRMLLILGPCSLNFRLGEATVATAQMLAGLQSELPGVKILMRLPGEKPRSGNKANDWAGAITDPDMDGSMNQANGILRTRQMYNEVLATGIPLASEQLDLNLWAHVRDQLSLGWLGSRNLQVNVHWRQISAEPMPFGFKNGTDGDTKTILGAMRTAGSPQVFLGRDHKGADVMMASRGNRALVPVLRGSETGANFSAAHQNNLAARIAADPVLGIDNPGLLVDCAHGNCLVDGKKTPGRQVEVLNYLTDQIAAGNVPHLRGIMLETFIDERSATDPVVVLPQIINNLVRLNAAILSMRN
jgi:3-deoxy-7-phosphoheptulonate synthase